MEPTVEILQRLTRIETKLDAHIMRIEDHEKRIRFLERYAFVLLGIFSVATLAIQIISKS